MSLRLLVLLAALATAGAAPPRRSGGEVGNSIDAAPSTAAPDDDADEDAKTLSQQIADGKYGLIQKELFGAASRRPGVLSYAPNAEVPRDTARTLGGLRPDEIWLAEEHVLVLRGGVWHSEDPAPPHETWPPIDDYRAPPRQVKLPARPKVPPPFPVRLADGEPTRLLGDASPFPFPPPEANITQGPSYPYAPPGNYPPGGGPLFPPPGSDGSLSPSPSPFPPPRNGSLLGQPQFPPPRPGNFPPGNGPLYPPTFPFPFPVNGTPFPPHLFPFPPPQFPFPQNGSYPPFPYPVNGSLPPPQFFPGLPPGAVFLPPPESFNETLDEDDPSIYYPPPYDFFYPKDNTTEVPPGPLVPGIILPPPPDFFAPLENVTEIAVQKTTTSTTTPAPRYLPPSTTQRRKKPLRTTTVPPPPELPPKKIPLITIFHNGASPLKPPQSSELYERPVTTTKSPLFVTASPAPQVSYVVVPVTEIVVHSKPEMILGQKRPPSTTPAPPAYYYERPKSSGGSILVPSPQQDRTPKKSIYLFEEPPSLYYYDPPRSSPYLQYYNQLYNYESAPRAPVATYRSTPRTLFEFSFQQPIRQTTARPRYVPPVDDGYYTTTSRPRYHTPAPDAGYEYYTSSPRPPYQNADASYYSTTPRPRYQPTVPVASYYSSTPKPQYQTPDVPYYSTTPRPRYQSSYYSTTPKPRYQTTPNPLLALFTRQEQNLFDENTKKYFTMFGKKLEGQEATTPLSLEGDTLVNYRSPLPAVEPDAELISYPLPGQGAHAYFSGYSYPAPPAGNRLRYRRRGRS